MFILFSAVSSSDSSTCLLKAADTVLYGVSCLNMFRSLHWICRRQMLCFTALYLFSDAGFPDTKTGLSACFNLLQYLQNITLFSNSSHGDILNQFALNLYVLPPPATVDVEVTAGDTVASLTASCKPCEEASLVEPCESPSPDYSFSSSLIRLKYN